VKRDIPVLGVCLGAQLLAHALGANVFRGQQPEIGFAPVELTTEGRRDVIFNGVPSPVPVFHWHGDTFDLPVGAALLASSANYSNQAFRFGKRAYGLQFHLEPDAPAWAEWRQRLPASLFDDFDRKRIRLREIGRKVIANFFDLAS
jgi:GMP synthase (glutamine-hydrolysing)